jgi:uncharacterized protein (TIGR02246 family)
MMKLDHAGRTCPRPFEGETEERTTMPGMRSLAISLLVLGLTAGTALAQESQDVDGIRKLMRQHDAALNAQDLDAVMADYASDGDVVLMGSGPGEFWQGREAIAETYRKFFEDFDPGSLTVTCPWSDAGVDGTAGWFAASCLVGDVLDGATREYVLNVSASLAKESGDWRLRSLHASNLTAAEQQ